MYTSKEKLLAILDNMDEGIVLLDASFHVLSFNKTIERTLLRQCGKELHEGDDFRDFLLDTHHSAFSRSFKKALEGEAAAFEIEIKSTESSAWFQYKMHSVNDADGSFMGIALIIADITSRKHKDLLHKDLVDSFGAIVENTTESILLLSKEYKILRYNKIAKERISRNIRKEIFLGADFRDFLYHPEENLFLRLFATASEGRPAEAEFCIANLDNDPVWIQTRLYPVYNAEQDLVAVSVFAQNISLRKQAEIALKERIKELSTIYHVSSFLQNEAMPDEPLLQNIVELLPAGWQFPDICSARIGLEGQDFLSKHYTASTIKQTAHFKTIQGKKGLIEVLYDETKMPFPDPAFLQEERELIDTLAEMLSVHYNKKALLNELKKSEAQLASVFENTKIGLLLLDKNLSILTYNQTSYDYYLAATGSKLERNADFHALMLDEKKEWLSTVSQKVLENRKPLVYDSSYERNGNTYHFNVNISPVVENGEVIGFCHSVVDITERKKQEQERHSMIVELTQINKDLEQFAYIVSHNLRGPLSTILGLGQLLSYDMDLEDRQETFKGITASAEKLDRVLKDVNAILQTKRIVTQKRQKVLFDDLFEKVHHHMAPVLSERKALISHNFEEVKSIVSVEAYLEDIFYQLISNSINHARPNVAPHIDIWSERKEGKVVLNFSDNGKGIDLSKYGNQVFGLYKRFNMETPGRGLGLFMVKTQTEALNGVVSIESMEGKGTHIALSFADS